MKFSEKLNEYIEEIDCSASDISEKSSLSAATISRYRKGERIPDASSAALNSISAAISELSANRSEKVLSAEDVKKSFIECSDVLNVDTEAMRHNLNMLIETLDFNINKLCSHVNYDSSTVFRIRNGSRKPSDPIKFAKDVADFAAYKTDLSGLEGELSELTGYDEETLKDPEKLSSAIADWLVSGTDMENESVSVFLNNLDSFDLNEYIRSIKFDQLKVPAMPFTLPGRKNYFGLEEFKESKISFIKATVLSKSMEPVTMYSDMPMEEMAKDTDFAKKWMFGMAMMLKKGLHLNQIHNLDRSLKDMMLGLESWIPMYMTGQISPYYFKNIQNNAFMHLIKVSGASALIGEAISGHHENGKYYLTKNKDEVAHYRKRCEDMLKVANPLMDIYRSERAKNFGQFLTSDSALPGKRKNIYATLPLALISDKTLEAVFLRNGFSEEEKETVLKVREKLLENYKNILKGNVITDIVPDISEEEFRADPISLDLSAAFFEKTVSYTYEEYKEHLRSCEEFAETSENYILKKNECNVFRNLQILIREGKWACVSKATAPAIHFVIHHPKLRLAIENFTPPLVE